jgi:hypothetical protein
MALSAALKILVAFAVEHVGDCPPQEQIKIYSAIADTHPNPLARSSARELAVALSRVAALQLDFSEQLDLQSPTGDGHPDHGNH